MFYLFIFSNFSDDNCISVCVCGTWKTTQFKTWYVKNKIKVNCYKQIEW